jgi:hypothetical protein
MAVTGLRPDFAHRSEEIGTADPACVGKPDPTAPPDKRHPVLSCQSGSIERVPNLGVALGFNQAVDRRAANVLASALFVPSLDHRHGLRKIDRGYADSEDVHPGNRARDALQRIVAITAKFRRRHNYPALSNFLLIATSQPRISPQTYLHFLHLYHYHARPPDIALPPD